MKINVQNKNGELSFDCGENESILYAGLRQGVGLPYECATGTCGTCRARVTAHFPRRLRAWDRGLRSGGDRRRHRGPRR